MEKRFRFINWGLLSRHRVSIMACAMIWIMLFHANQTGVVFPGCAKVLSLFMRRGNAGVDMFLLLSGIGLYFSYRKNPDVFSFYKKRLQRVLLPYLFIGGVFWIIADLLWKKDIVLFLKDITLISFWKDGITRSWFVALILLLYAVFPAIWKFACCGEKVKTERLVFLIVAVMGMNYVLGMWFPDWFDLVEIALARIPVFLVGIALAEKVWEKQPVKLSECIVLLALCGLKILMNMYKIKGVYSRYWLAVFAVCICIVLGIVFELCERNLALCKLTNLIGPIGTWSLELYIVHVWVRRFLLKLDISYVIGGINLDRYGVMTLLMLVIGSALITWCAVWIEKRLFFNKKM